MKSERVFLILPDSEPMEMAYDFNAIACHQRTFEGPLRAKIEKVRAEAPENISEQELEKACIAAGVPEVASMIEGFGNWAYAFTSTWREDNDVNMTWKEFKRLLPIKPCQAKEFGSWMDAVQRVLAEAHGVDLEAFAKDTEKQKAIKKKGQSFTKPLKKPT